MSLSQTSKNEVTLYVVVRRYTVQKKYSEKILVEILKKYLQWRPDFSSASVLRRTETIKRKIFIKIGSIATSLKEKSLTDIFLRNFTVNSYSLKDFLDFHK